MPVIHQCPAPVRSRALRFSVIVLDIPPNAIRRDYAAAGSLQILSLRYPPKPQENLGGFTGFPAKALGPGSDSEKYIFAAFVVPKSRLEPEFCT